MNELLHTRVYARFASVMFMTRTSGVLMLDENIAVQGMFWYRIVDRRDG